MQLDPLRKREVFHLAFLRALSRTAPPQAFALKGGSNLRFYFGSIRYSEDMDLDVEDLAVHTLQEKVLAVLGSSGLLSDLLTYGIERVEPPDIARAKQTETVQRFEVHLHTTAGEDLFTKVEFSRRGFDSPIRAEAVSPSVLSSYHMAPLVFRHYTAAAAVRQKIGALLNRREAQARDVFDLFTLRPHAAGGLGDEPTAFSSDELAEARDRAFQISYEQYRDTVVSFLGPGDRETYLAREVWDEIVLNTVALLESGVDHAG